MPTSPLPTITSSHTLRSRRRWAAGLIAATLLPFTASCSAAEPARSLDPSAPVTTAVSSTVSSAGSGEPVEGAARFDARFTHGNAVVDGLPMHYVQGGSGPPLVLVHGFPQTWWEWHQVMPALAERFTVIAVDLPGLGDSAVPDGGFEHANTARRVHDLVAGLGHQRVALLAHDIGAWFAYPYARDFPDAVTELIVMETVLPGFGPQVTHDGSIPAPGSFHYPFHAAPAPLPEELVAGQEDLYFAHFYDTYSAVPGAVTAEDRAEFVAKYRREGALTAAFNYYRALPAAAEDNRARAEPKITPPVLAIGGERSTGPALAESMRPVATDVQQFIVPATGHWIPEERPALLAGCVAAFLQRTPPTDLAPELAACARPVR